MKTTKARAVYLVLGAIVLVAIVLRALAVVYEPAHHPDEYFQYLEPAWLRLTGVGVETWEWRDGVRSWFLPGYHGAWMALLLRLGIRNGRAIITILHVHWALLSLVLVWAGWRGGALLSRWPDRKAAPSPVDDSLPPAGWQGGLIGAFLCATFPLLVRFSVHTFSELASILCLVCALVLAGELAERPGPARWSKVVVLGLLLGLGFCLRIQHGTVLLFAGLWLLWTRRFRALLWTCAIALVPIFFFGLLDRLTWGEFFGSYIRYVKFNLVQGGAAMFGTQPSTWYVQQFLSRLPISLSVLGLVCLLGLRTNWPFVGSAVGLLLLLSTQGHKEERFVMLCWPLVLIALAGTLGGWLRLVQSCSGSIRWFMRRGVAVVVLLVLVDGTLHCKGNDFPGLDIERFQAHAWISRQPDVTGLLYDQPFYVPGYMGFSHSVPQLEARTSLLSNPLFSHALLSRHSGLAIEAERAGFTEVYSVGDFVVLRRPPDLH
jgi:phosphatidylinositol glycan class B